jgi:hypothetical protein
MAQQPLEIDEPPLAGFAGVPPAGERFSAEGESVQGALATW